VRQAKSAARTADLIPVIEAIRAEGITSATGIAKVLNDRGLPTIRGYRKATKERADAIKDPPTTQIPRWSDLIVNETVQDDGREDA